MREHEAGIGKSIRDGCDSDVVLRANVHFPAAAKVGHAFEVAADRPPARPERMLRQTQSTRQARFATIGGDHQPSALLATAAIAGLQHDPGDRTSRAQDRRRDFSSLHELRARSHCGLDEYRVEHAPGYRAPVHTRPVAADDRHAGTRQHHAIERKTARQDRVE